MALIKNTDMSFRFFDTLLQITALLLMTITPVIHTTLSIKRLKNKITFPLWAINLISAVLGFSLPVLAMFVSMTGLAPGIKCATGCVGFMALGWLVSIISFPIIAVWAYLISENKKNKPLIL
jgi:hypothetical protein